MAICPPSAIARQPAQLGPKYRTVDGLGLRPPTRSLEINRITQVSVQPTNAMRNPSIELVGGVFRETIFCPFQRLTDLEDIGERRTQLAGKPSKERTSQLIKELQPTGGIKLHNGLIGEEEPRPDPTAGAPVSSYTTTYSSRTQTVWPSRVVVRYVIRNGSRV